MDNDFATGYALGSDSGGNRNDGMWGGDGWWAIIIFAMIFGWGNGGFGGFGGGGNQGALTRADLCSEFNFNDLQGAVRGVSQGICDSTYALNNSITSGFSQAELSRCSQQAAIMQQLNNMAFQSQQCCCETQRQVERGFCDVGYAMATNTSNIIQANHNDTDRVIAKLNDMEATRQAEKVEALRLENQTLKFAASQANQNAVLGAQMDANTAELIRRIAPTPIPAYSVPAPYPYYGCYGYNAGCGCNTCGC